MNKTRLNIVLLPLFCIAMLILPLSVIAQTGITEPVAPQISQQLTREGEFAVKLQIGLGIGTSNEEVEAESALGEVGIAPKNGWIADYPVTPDILSEIRNSITDSVAAGKIELSGEEALKHLDDITAEINMNIKPNSATVNHQTSPEEAVIYPDQDIIDNYYSTEGPPVVTYYAPPQDYYYLYSWIPYPFWWSGFWFPGYFILNDFHKPYFYGHRAVFISNHFNQTNAHRVFRIDPVQRYNGRTYAGIGATNRKRFISTGIPRSEQRIFNANRSLRIGTGNLIAPKSRKMSVPPDFTNSFKYGTRSDSAPNPDNSRIRIDRGFSGMGGGRSGSSMRGVEGGRR